MDWYLVLLQAHGAGGQEALIPVLDGERQVLVKHLQVSLHTRGRGCVCVSTLTWLKGLSRPVSSTHTLHQVESLFREEMLFAMRREAHRLPKLALRDNSRLSDTHSKEIYNKTRLEKGPFRQSSQLESEAPPSAHLGSIWPSPGFPCQKRPVGC